jgi:hypothetical protein
MNDGRDIRELTRVIKDLTKATTALQNTLVDIERRRQDEVSPATVKDDTERLFGFCSSCMMRMCVVGVFPSKTCACCKTNHNLT